MLGKYYVNGASIIVIIEVSVFHEKRKYESR